MNFLSHLAFLQIGLFRVEAVDFGTCEDEENVARQAAAYGKACEPDDLAFPWV